MVWRNVLKTKTHQLKVEVADSNGRHTISQFTISGEMSGGTAGTSFFSQDLTGMLYAGGYYVFTSKIEDVCDLNGVPLLNDESLFWFVVTVGGVEYESNTLKYVSDSSGTKRLHYGSTSSYALDTRFSVVPKGYDIRLPSCFLHPKPAAESEIFDSYRKDVELVSAVPFETVELEIGRHVGVPDWWVKNLNHIFHCDRKSIDGVAYELTANAVLEPRYAEGYTFGWLTVELAPKMNPMSEVDGVADPVVGPGSAFREVWLTAAENGASKSVRWTGGLTSQMLVGSWYLSDDGSGLLKMLEVRTDQSARKGAMLSFAASDILAKKVNGMLLYVRDVETDELLMTIRLLQQVRRQGISFGAVGDTLFVYEKSLVN